MNQTTSAKVLDEERERERRQRREEGREEGERKGRGAEKRKLIKNEDRISQETSDS